MKIETSENLRNGERSADVAGLASVHHAQHLGAIFVGAAREIGNHLGRVRRAVRIDACRRCQALLQTQSCVHLRLNIAIERAANALKTRGAAVVDRHRGLAQERRRARHRKLRQHDRVDLAGELVDLFQQYLVVCFAVTLSKWPRRPRAA